MLPELEKISANIVALSAVDVAVSLNSQEIAPILPDASLEMAPPPIQQMRLVSLREQVVANLGGGAFIFSDQSADIPPKARLAEVVEAFLRLMASKGAAYRAYGFNFEVAFDSPGDTTAAELVLGRFIKTDAISKRVSMEPKGAGLRLYFDMANAICNLQLDPRLEEVNAPRFYAKINYHYELPEGALPQADVLKSDFQGKWGIFIDLLERLLLK
jgi:hypothetical protein